MKRYILALCGVFILSGISFAADCQKALTAIFGHEGGYQCIKADSGNWTGGKVGIGTLKGTKFGIAASSYPKEDIRNLTIQTAARYYERDYWNPLRLGDIKSQSLATAFLDCAVNCGTGTAAILVTRTINRLNGLTEDFPVDPVIGKRETDWINDYTQTRFLDGGKDKTRRALFYAVFGEMRNRYYVAIVNHNPKKLQFLPVWIARVYE